MSGPAPTGRYELSIGPWPAPPAQDARARSAGTGDLAEAMPLGEERRVTEAAVIPALMTVAWIIVVTTIICACHVAARADAADDDRRARLRTPTGGDARREEGLDDAQFIRAGGRRTTAGVGTYLS